MELNIEEHQTFDSIAVKSEFNSILRSRSSLNENHAEDGNKWIYDKSVLKIIDSKNSLIALVSGSVLTLIDMENSICFDSGLCFRTEETITSLLFIQDGMLIIGTAMGNIYILDCIINRIIYKCDMHLTPIIQLLEVKEYIWILSDDSHLVKIALDVLLESVSTNHFAFIGCENNEKLPDVECGTIVQQRYHLLGQKIIHHISICIISSNQSPQETDIHTPLSTPPNDDDVISSEIPFTDALPSDSFLVTSVGASPSICCYEIMIETKVSFLPKAVGVVKSIYGVVKSLAGWGWRQSESQQTTPIPRPRSIHRAFELTDSKRECIDSWASPSGQYVVVSDAISRVLLLDVWAGLVLHIWKGYRDVQCIWTESSCIMNGSEVNVSVLFMIISFILHSYYDSFTSHENRSFLEAYRVPSIVRVYNKHFADGCVLLDSCSHQYILYDRQEDIKSLTVCAKIALSSNRTILQPMSSEYRLHDIFFKNELIRLLRRCSTLSEEASHTEMGYIKEYVMKITDSSVFVRLLEDCFLYGVDLSTTYSYLLTACEEVMKNRTKTDVDSDYENIIKQLNYYNAIISWYFILLRRYQKRQSLFISSARVSYEDAGEIVQFQRVYEDQFGPLLSNQNKPSIAYSYRDLTLWIQCIRSTTPYRLRPASTLSRASQALLNALLFDCLFEDKELVCQFFKQFGNDRNDENADMSLIVEFLVQWILQLPLLYMSDVFFSEFHDMMASLLDTISEGRLNDKEEEFIMKAITSLTSPGHALLLCQLLHSDYEKKNKSNMSQLLLYQIRSVTVLSMAVNSQITIDNIKETTVQYYLACLNIPVEYIKFDNEMFSIDMNNWRNLIEIAVHPSKNYISLLSTFLPISFFYTVFIQIVVNHLTKLDLTNYEYMLRVLTALPLQRQFAFAGFCWKIVSSYIQEEIAVEMRENLDLNIFFRFMENTKKFSELILGCAEKLLDPLLASSLMSPLVDVAGDSESSVLLANYPFPITKGCYLSIEREFAAPLCLQQCDSLHETVRIVETVMVATKLKLTQEVPISVIPSTEQLFPQWSKYFASTFPLHESSTVCYDIQRYSQISEKTRHHRVKFVKLCLQSSIDCQSICSALDISPSFYTVLRACHMFISGRDDKADKLCRGAIKDLTVSERFDCIYELVSVAQAYIQESVQTANENQRIRLFDILPEKILTWLISHPSSAKVVSPSLTTSISFYYDCILMDRMVRRMQRFIPQELSDYEMMDILSSELNKCLRIIQTKSRD